MSAVTRFVVVSTQRSGSNWLEDRLDSHPDVVMRRSEPFRKTLTSDDAYVVWKRCSTTRRVIGSIAPPVTKARFLGWTTRPDAHAVGFRLMYDQMRRNPSLIPILRAQRFRVIHLVRHNVLDTVISVQRAKASGKFITRIEHDLPEPVELPIDGLRGELDRRTRLIERHRRLLRVFDSVEVCFEQYLDNPSLHDTALADFLGLDAAGRLDSGFARMSEPSLESKISNATAVRRVLQSTPYEHLLDGSVAPPGPAGVQRQLPGNE